MTPGLAFFYGGRVRRKNVLTIMMQSFIAMGVVTVIWVLVGFSLAYSGDTWGVIGDFKNVGLLGVGLAPSHIYAPTVPFLALFLFQAMFAIITLSAEVNEADRQHVEEGLLAFNATASPYFAVQPENKGQALDAFVRDSAGTILGAVTAHTTWDWLSIELVWLDERLRGRGYGARLMRAVEEEARRRGCAHVRVTTYCFQAPGFYERLGYRVVGRLDDFPPGGAYYWLRKDFAP